MREAIAALWTPSRLAAMLIVVAAVIGPMIPGAGELPEQAWAFVGLAAGLLLFRGGR